MSGDSVRLRPSAATAWQKASHKNNISVFICGKGTRFSPNRQYKMRESLAICPILSNFAAA
jgi:hypothetical protein